MKKAGIWGTLHPFFEDGPVFGRKMANTGFLAALLRADPFESYHFFIRNLGMKLYLEKRLQADYPEMWKEGRFKVGPVAWLPEALAANHYSCFHLSDWVGSFVDLSILRNAFSGRIFPITAPVHTLSYAHYGEAFLRHLWGGVSGRERIVATSEATRGVIAGYFGQLRREYRLDEAVFPAPGVARIPLAVEPAQFAAPKEKTSSGERFRRKFGLSENQVMFLSFSRVSYLSKMDFLPILDAFRRAMSLGLKPGDFHFVLAGRMDKGDPFKEAVQRLAAQNGVPFSLEIFPDLPDDELRAELFAAADVFVSPVDNIQETFGLTVLEAYAASLPVVASAIDGYRELVRDGESGILVPTLGPSSAAASSSLSAMLPTDVYHLYLAQQTVVEAEPFAEALLKLAADPELRRRMGEKARELVLAEYTWDKVITDYRSLWDELNAIELPDGALERLRRARHPSLPDYLPIFRDYFSASFDEAARAGRMVRVSARGRALLSGQESLVVYKLVEERVDGKRLNALLAATARPVELKGLGEAFAVNGPDADRDFLLLWALKHDLLEFVDS